MSSLDHLAALFAGDIELWSDGGPSARARFGTTRKANEANLASGRELSFASFRRPCPARPRVSSDASRTSATKPGVVGFVDGRVMSAITFVVEDGLIRSIYIEADPEKLSRVSLPS